MSILQSTIFVFSARPSVCCAVVSVSIFLVLCTGGCGRFLGTRLGVSKLPAVLHRAEPPEGLLDPLLTIVHEVGLEPAHELPGRHALPVPVVEELVLEAPEEALAGRVARAAALRGHAPDQAVLLADPDPLRPAVVAAPVRVDRRAPARRC